MTNLVRNLQAAPVGIEALGVILTYHVGQPVKTWELVRSCGDVAVVSFDYWTLPDPVMPLTVLNLGDTYIKHWRKFAEGVTRWSPSLPSATAKRWYENQRQAIDIMSKFTDDSPLSLMGKRLHRITLEWAAANPHKFITAQTPDELLADGRIDYPRYLQLKWVAGK